MKRTLASILASFALIALGFAAALPARAAEHIVEVKWSPAGEFGIELAVAPKKFKELCVSLKDGQRVAWSFSADSPMTFNIHYHEGSDVTYPAKRDGVLWDYGVLDVSTNQDYCWMWKAAPEHGARLSVTLKKTAE